MITDKKILRYLKQKFYSGKRLSAQFADRMLGTWMIWICLTLLLRSYSLRLPLAMLLSAAFSGSLLIFYLLLQRFRFAKFLSAEQTRAKEALLLEHLMLLPKKQYRVLCRQIFAEKLAHRTLTHYHGGYWQADTQCFCYAFFNHPQDNVTLRQIFSLHRLTQDLPVQSYLLLSPAPYADDAKAFCKRLGIEVTLLEPAAFLQLAHRLLPPVSQKSITDFLAQEMAQYRLHSPRKGNWIAPGKHRGYLLCAFFLVCWYLLFRLSPFYLLSAALCCVLALCSYRGAKQFTK